MPPQRQGSRFAVGAAPGRWPMLGGVGGGMQASTAFAPCLLFSSFSPPRRRQGPWTSACEAQRASPYGSCNSSGGPAHERGVAINGRCSACPAPRVIKEDSLISRSPSPWPFLRLTAPILCLHVADPRAMHSMTTRDWSTPPGVVLVWSAEVPPLGGPLELSPLERGPPALWNPFAHSVEQNCCQTSHYIRNGALLDPGCPHRCGSPGRRLRLLALQPHPVYFLFLPKGGGTDGR